MNEVHTPPNNLTYEKSRDCGITKSAIGMARIRKTD